MGSAGVLGSGEAARYWSYHLARSGFFLAQGLAGLLAARGAVGRDADSPVLTRFEAMFRTGWAGPLTEALLMFYQDYEQIKEGAFALPWDMTTTGHRQFNPLYVLRKATAFVSEAADTLRRRCGGCGGAGVRCVARALEKLWRSSALLVFAKCGRAACRAWRSRTYRSACSSHSILTHACVRCWGLQGCGRA